MPVPSSGTITLGKIGKELRSSGTGDDYDNGPDTSNSTSLTQASTGNIDAINTGNDSADRPDASTPHAMSEFYSYDHNISGVSAPSNFSYSALSTTTFSITYTEGSGGNRTYFYLGSGVVNGSIGESGEAVNVNGSLYVSGDGSGTQTITIGDTSADEFYDDEEEDFVSFDDYLGPNDYVSFRARARLNAGSYSSYASDFTAYTLPGATGTPTLSASSTSVIAVSWTAPAGGASSYRVYYGTSTNPTGNQTTLASGGNITGLSAGTTYYFRTKAVGGGGDFGAYSSNANAKTLCNVPTSFSGTGSTTSVTLSWTAPTGASSYEIAYKLSTAPSYMSSTVSTSSPKTVTGLSTASTYNFKIRAYNGTAYGNYTSPITVSTSGGGGKGKGGP